MADYNSSLPVRTQNNGDVVIEVADGTTPSQKLAINSAGSAQVAGQGVAGTPAGGVVSVQGVSGGTALPISGTVTATNPSVSTVGTTPPASATYVGGLTAASSPTYSAGNMEPFSLTDAGALRTDASATTQPISGTVTANQGTAAALAGAWPVEVTDGTNVLGTSSHPLRIDPTGTTTQPISGTVAVSSISGTVATNITQILGAAPSVTNALPSQISTAGAYVSASNPLPVTIDPAAAGTPKNYYTDTTAVAAGSSATQPTTVAGTTGFYLQQVLVSGSGKFKAVVQIAGTTFFAAFNSTAQPSVIIPIPNNTLVATGAVVQVIMTNLDLAAQDLYSTISGFQV